MKKIILITVAVVLVAAIALTAVMIFANTKTGGGSTSDSARKTSSAIIDNGAVYKLVSVSRGGRDDSDSIASLEKAGMDTTLRISGKRAEMLDGIYTYEDGTIYNDYDSYTCVSEGGKVTLDNGKGEIMVFEKQ